MGVIIIVVILISICLVSAMLANELMKSRLRTQQVMPVLVMPTASLPPAMPAIHLSAHLPIILSGSVPVAVPVPEPEQIWIVTKIKSMGYELDGQSNDLATFTRIDGQETAMAYCINRGWAIPDIGAEYSLNSDGIFSPLHEADANPLQRFLRIQ